MEYESIMSLCNLEHGISRIKIFLLGLNFSSFKRVEIEWMEREKILRTIEKEKEGARKVSFN